MRAREHMDASLVLGQNKFSVGAEAEVLDIWSQRKRKLLLENQSGHVPCFDNGA